MVGAAREETIEGRALLGAGKGEDSQAHRERDHRVNGNANTRQAWPESP